MSSPSNIHLLSRLDLAAFYAVSERFVEDLSQPDFSDIACEAGGQPLGA